MEAEEIVAAVRTVPAYQHIPVLLFSALPGEEGERRRVQCGAAAFVHKPSNLEEFVAAVLRMVHGWGGGASEPKPKTAASGEPQ
jgi:response regulator RpfG family c-di-GMP phosphodiesterase